MTLHSGAFIRLLPRRMWRSQSGMFSGSRRYRGRARPAGGEASEEETESTVKAQTDVTIPSGWRTTKVRLSHSPPSPPRPPSAVRMGEKVKYLFSGGINGKLIAATAPPPYSSHRRAAPSIRISDYLRRSEQIERFAVNEILVNNEPAAAAAIEGGGGKELPPWLSLSLSLSQLEVAVNDVAIVEPR